jgi:nitroimidazol reductase NimA-like FMN-containing flavoprotein (pyridoxamine 5'-phosphate oxidase superfamily)
MTDASDDAVRGSEMTPAEVDELLTERGYGTLSLSAGGRAYSVPISFGYDGDRVFMELLTFGEHSRKLEYLEGTDEACLVAMEVEGQSDWRSVVVTGPIEEVDEDEAAYHEAVVEENGWLPFIYPRAEPLTGVVRVAMEPSELTGRKGAARRPD